MCDTIKDLIPDGPVTMESLVAFFAKATKDMHGAVLVGGCELQRCTLFEWGAAVDTPDGGKLHVRTSPRGAIQNGVCESRTLLIATHRTRPDEFPEVGFAVLFKARKSKLFSRAIPITGGNSIGTKAVHVFLPSLFHRHFPSRVVKHDTSILVRRARVPFIASTRPHPPAPARARAPTLAGAVGQDCNGYHVLASTVVFSRHCFSDMTSGIITSTSPSYVVLGGHLVCTVCSRTVQNCTLVHDVTRTLHV